MESARLPGWAAKAARPVAIGAAVAVTVGLCTASAAQAASAPPGKATARTPAAQPCAVRVIMPKPVPAPAARVRPVGVPVRMVKGKLVKGPMKPLVIRGRIPAGVIRVLPLARCAVARVPIACSAQVKVTSPAPARVPLKAVPMTPAVIPAKAVPAIQRVMPQPVPAIQRVMPQPLPAIQRVMPQPLPAIQRVMPQPLPAIQRVMPRPLPAGRPFVVFPMRPCAVPVPAVRCALTPAVVPSLPQVQVIVPGVRPAKAARARFVRLPMAVAPACVRPLILHCARQVVPASGAKAVKPVALPAIRCLAKVKPAQVRK